MHSFISSGVEAAVPLSKVSDESLAQLLQIPLRDAAARRAELARQHADERWVRETLRKLPEVALVVLSIVADYGARISTGVLSEQAQAQYRMSVAEVHAGIGAAVAHMLLVPLAGSWGEHLLFLVSPAAERVAAQVLDLDLDELPGGELVPGDGPGGRALLAACMALRHFDVKLTQAGQPHRAPVKRLARLVGVTEDLLEEILVTAMVFGLLSAEEDQEILRPDVDRLLQAAEGRYPGCGIVEALTAALERGPVSSAELHRWLLRSPPGRVGAVGASSLGYLPGFRTGTVGGIEAIGRAAIEGAAAGHITPSFEVFLPPESRFADIVRIGGCSELVRIDRMMVWRLTKSSVRRSVAAGAGASQILAALAGASRAAVPQNVEVAVRDWAGSTTTAALARGHVIAVDPAVADRMRAVLADLEPSELAPGVFVVDEDTPLDMIHARLRRADVSSCARVVPVDGQALVPTAGIERGSSELRERIAAWRRRRGRDRTGAPRPRGTAARQGAAAASGAAATRDAAIVGLVRDLGAMREPIARELEPQVEGLVARIASGEFDKARLAWVREEIGPRLHRIAADAPLALDLGSSIRSIRFSRLLQRGGTWLVLGEDLDTDEAVAVALTKITGFTILDGSAAAAPVPEPGSSARTSAPAGAPNLPGHVRCPCGSGARYRNCCRP